MGQTDGVRHNAGNLRFVLLANESGNEFQLTISFVIRCTNQQ